MCLTLLQGKTLGLVHRDLSIECKSELCRGLSFSAVMRSPFWNVFKHDLGVVDNIHMPEHNFRCLLLTMTLCSSHFRIQMTEVGLTIACLKKNMTPAPVPLPSYLVMFFTRPPLYICSLPYSSLPNLSAVGRGDVASPVHSGKQAGRGWKLGAKHPWEFLSKDQAKFNFHTWPSSQGKASLSLQPRL